MIVWRGPILFLTHCHMSWFQKGPTTIAKGGQCSPIVSQQATQHEQMTCAKNGAPDHSRTVSMSTDIANTCDKVCRRVVTWGGMGSNLLKAGGISRLGGTWKRLPHKKLGTTRQGMASWACAKSKYIHGRTCRMPCAVVLSCIFQGDPNHPGKPWCGQWLHWEPKLEASDRHRYCSHLWP